MSTHDEQTIDRAVRAMGRALAAGADHKAAMRAALNAAASTGCLREYSVTVDTVGLVAGFDADIEDGWVIVAPAGTDLAPLLARGELFERIDKAVIHEMERMERIETKKLLPALTAGYKRVLLQLQSNSMRWPVNCEAWVDYELLSKRTLNIEGDDIAAVAVRSVDGVDLLNGEGPNWPDMSECVANTYRCAQRAAAGHEYALEAEDLEASRARRAERMLTGVL